MNSAINSLSQRFKHFKRFDMCQCKPAIFNGPKVTHYKP